MPKNDQSKENTAKGGLDKHTIYLFIQFWMIFCKYIFD